MLYDYFVASRYRNKQRVLELVERLRAPGKRTYCFMETGAAAVTDDPEAVMKQFEGTPDWRNDVTVRAHFERDMAALRASNNVVLLLPAGTSAHIEAGVAFGLGKHLILIGEPEKVESLYLVFDEVYESIDRFVGSL